MFMGKAQTEPARMAPIVAAPRLQARFWTGAGPGAAAIVGDWQNFRDVYDGFPTGLGVPDTAAGAVAQALSAAIHGTSTLQAALAAAETRMNAEMVQ